MSKPQGVWTNEDTALILIDYQKEMFEGVASETPADVIDLNVRLLIKAAKAFGMPIVLSTVGVEMGVNGTTRQSILDELPGVVPIDRSSMNAWEDEAFLAAVKATGKKRLIFAALWTEICLVFPVVDALKDGYDVSYVVDAVGGLSQLAHRTAIDRLAHAGAVPNTSLALVTELFRDWAGPLGDQAREIITPYLGEVKALAAA
ncbi:isochorismatase family protein [uncultured Sphingomonas sp.]|uniref:isochorismatase family protein n=1 Tax=uncultured Sphingomonas sp. TaxID=158754 RepID=UPI0035C9E03A